VAIVDTRPRQDAWRVLTAFLSQVPRSYPASTSPALLLVHTHQRSDINLIDLISYRRFILIVDIVERAFTCATDVPCAPVARVPAASRFVDLSDHVSGHNCVVLVHRTSGGDEEAAACEVVMAQGSDEGRGGSEIKTVLHLRSQGSVRWQGTPSCLVAVVDMVHLDVVRAVLGWWRCFAWSQQPCASGLTYHVRGDVGCHRSAPR